MFDLKYFASVSVVMDWTKNSPPVKFANLHQSYVNHRSSMSAHMHDFKELTEDQAMMRQYIFKTYPPYFGVKLNFGNYASRNMDTLYF